jgi:hypothetical protein
VTAIFSNKETKLAGYVIKIITEYQIFSIDKINTRLLKI